MSPRPDVSAQRKPQILDAAYAVFLAKGVAGATIADIAREAGVSTALIFLYFQSKDELLLAFFQRYFGAVHERLAELEQSKLPVTAALMAWCDGLAAELGTEGGQALGQELLALASRDVAIRAVVAEAYEAYRAALSRMLGRGMMRGEIGAGNADAIAVSLIAMIEGLNVLQLASGSGDLAGAYRRGIGQILPGFTRQGA